MTERHPDTPPKGRTMSAVLEAPSSSSSSAAQPAAANDPVPGLPLPDEPAHVIRGDAEAIAVAHALAAKLIVGASERDRLRRWPVEEIDAYSQSGL